jgi:hypothetical protein
MTLLAKEDQKEWFDDLISMIESLCSLSIFGPKDNMDKINHSFRISDSKKRRIILGCS